MVGHQAFRGSSDSTSKQARVRHASLERAWAEIGEELGSSVEEH